MMWNKTNKIMELQDSNNAYANAQNLLNEKIGELESQLVMVQGALDNAQAALSAVTSDRDRAVEDLAEAETDLVKKDEELIELTAGYLKVMKDCANLENRCDILELVLKQLQIPVILSAKKK